MVHCGNSRTEQFSLVVTKLDVKYFGMMMSFESFPLERHRAVFPKTTRTTGTNMLCFGTRCFVHLHNMSCALTQYVLCTNTICFVHLHNMFCALTQYVLCTNTICFVHLHNMFFALTQYVLCMHKTWCMHVDHILYQDTRYISYTCIKHVVCKYKICFAF